MADWFSLREQALTDIHEEFGETVTHHPDVGFDQDVTATFFDEHTAYEETGRGGVSTTAPRLETRLGAFDEAPQIDDEFTVRDTRYAVIDVHPDGRGSATIMLRQV